MDNDPRPILPGSRVRAYDPAIDAFADGTVLCRYGYKSISHSDVVYDDYGDRHGEPKVWLYPDLVDVRFDHDGRESHGHFTRGVEML